MQHGFPGAQSDWAAILELLKAEEEFSVYQGAMEMRDRLAYAQENQLHGFMTEQFMDILVKIVARDPMTDLSNEVKFFAVQCLSTLMDIFPQLVNGLVNAGLVKGMTTALQGSVGFAELSEACIKAYEKIVVENPPAVLRSGAVVCIFQQMDFFELSTQNRIFRIVQKIARHSTTEADFDTHLLPILPFICMQLNLDAGQGDQKRVEDVSKIVCEFQESFCIFYSPSADFQKVGQQFDKLLECGVFDIILAHVHQYSEISVKIQGARARVEAAGAGNSPVKQNGSDPLAMEIDGEGQIDSAGQSQVLTHQTILNFFKILENACRYSSKVANKLFGQSELLHDLCPFLPHDLSGKRRQYNAEDFPLITEVINLLSSVFSEKQSAQQEFKGSSLADGNHDALQKRLLGKMEFETEKRNFQLASDNRSIIVGIAEHLLPRIFMVYDQSTVNPQFRIRTLQVIDKIIALFDDELLKDFIEPEQFASFIVQILRSKHSSSIDVSLKITRKVMDCSPQAYSVPFIREGVRQLIHDLSEEDTLKAFLGIGKDVDIRDTAFDLDVHEIKEALHFTRMTNPDDHAMRDFYERKLIDLVEQQKHSSDAKQPAADKKLGEADKNEKPKEQKLNIAEQIIAQAKALLTDYFENQEFIANLEKFSPATKQQLNMLGELTQLSQDLCVEATQTQDSADALANIRRLLTRVAELLTLEQCRITSHEFKQSNLLLALELLLTKSPSQAKVLLEKKRANESGEEMKRAEEIDMMEAQKQSKQLSKKESRCIMSRLKLFAHILLIKKSGSTLSPMRALIELNHDLISENDAFILGDQSGPGGPGGRGGPGSGSGLFSGSGLGGPGMSGLFGGPSGAAGDYDHCISALRQLQKRVTVNLIYDPKKQNYKQAPPGAPASLKALKKDLITEPKQPTNEDQLQLQEPEDSQMEDQTPESQEVEKQKDAENKSDANDGSASPLDPALEAAPTSMKKAQSQHPSLMHLAGSPTKDPTGAAMEHTKVNQSKVYIKRHYLFGELSQIPVTVEQSSCLQILEDFLRNRIKTIDHVKGLRFDYGFGGGGPPGSSSSSPFGGAFGGHYQSITQKILRKNLGNSAKKLLDRANERLAKILNTGPAYKIKQAKKKGKKARKDGGDGYDDEMEGVEAEEKSGSGHSDDAEQSGGGENDSDKDSGGSDAYSDMDEDEEDEHEMAADVEKQRLLDLYVEELPDEVINSDIPEEQQHMLVKILTRQHAFMIDQLKMNYEDAAGDQAEEELAEMAAAREEDMYRLEERLEDFQETMERVQARFTDKKAEQSAKKAEQKPKDQEEQKQGSGEQPKPSEAKGLQKLAEDSDQEMNDQSQDVEDQKKKAEAGDATEEAQESSLAPVAKDAAQSSSPHVKLTGNANDAEMMKPADHSDAEPQNDNDMEGDANAEIKKDSPENKEEDLETKKKHLEKMLEKEFEEQDKKIQKALEREKELRQQIKDVKQDVQERTAEEGSISEQTEAVLQQDLEELIKQEGEDIDFEFYYEGKQIWSNQSIFEIIRDGEKKRKQIEKVVQKAEQVRALQEKEEELRRRARRLAESKTEDNEAERNKLKKESDRLKDLFNQLSSQFGAAGSMRGGPPGFAAGINAHKIYFCIKDRADEMADLKRQRLDSLAELTGSAQKRVRTKSEAIRDISSSAIHEFVASILQKEFKVFEEEAEEDKDSEEKAGLLAKIDEEMEGEKVIESSSEPKKAKELIKKPKESAHDQAKEQLGQSLKILKALNFLFANQDLISSKGIRFIMKSNDVIDEEANAADFAEPGFSDLDLKVGFTELQASFFHHHKLDSYLQKSIKDPYNLVQGAISSTLQQIFQNCPFLFPFSTKQLYFKLVSFISAIDVHRAIYFLRQHMKQSGQKLQDNDKDKRTITRQKVQIQRDKLIPSGFALISKIDKRAFLAFEFQGEEGVGLGPTLEFYDNIADEFKRWTIPVGEGKTFTMWRLAADNLLFPSPVCLRSLAPEYIKQIYEIFRLCGTIVAKAIVDDRQIDLPISALFWRLCLGDQMSIFDVQKLDDTIFNTLAEFQVVAAKARAVEKQAAAKNLSDEVRDKQLEGLTMSNGSRVEDYALAFTLPCYDEVELIPGGRDRGVALANAQDYVDLVLHHTFHETVKLQVSAFKKGFNSIFPISSLAPFCHASCGGGDLESIVCGSASTAADWSPEALTKHIDPDRGYTRKSPQYLHFIRYISELPAAPKSELERDGSESRAMKVSRPAFLKFLTGSKRLPVGGFASLAPHLTLVLKEGSPGQHPDQILPSVMACQNCVKAPAYSTYETMAQRFDYAVAEGQQNFTLS